jgi:hypothetical protein
MLLAGSAWARDVYLNGVKLESTVVITNQTFQGCDVEFDAKGDVHITAKGYKISLQKDQPQAAVKPAAAGHKFYVSTVQSGRSGYAQYAAVIMLNNQIVAKIHAGDVFSPLDVTDLVHQGNNNIQFIAEKTIGERRLSMSPDDTFQITMGEGMRSGETVQFSHVVLDMKRDASETQTFSASADFNAP